MQLRAEVLCAVGLLVAPVAAALADPPHATLRSRLDADFGVILWDVSADGKYLLTRSFDSKRSRVWGASTGKELPLAVELSDGVAFTPGGKHLVVDKGFRVSLFDWAAGKETDVLFDSTRPSDDPSPLRHLGATPDGKRLVFATRVDPPRLLFWDVAAHKVVRTELPAGRDRVLAERPLFVSGGAQVVLTDHGDRSRHGSITAWSVDPAKKLADLAGGGTFFDPVLSPDSKLLAAEVPFGTAPRAIAVRVWDTATWKQVKTLPGVRGPHFTSDGKALITLGLQRGDEYLDRIVRWACGTWKQVADHKPPMERASQISLYPSPNGRWVVYSSNRDATAGERRRGADSIVGQLRLFDAQTARADLLCDNADTAWWLPDGRTVAVSRNGTTVGRLHPLIELWEFARKDAVPLGPPDRGDKK